MIPYKQDGLLDKHPIKAAAWEFAFVGSMPSLYYVTKDL